jgi:hypothetical protein
MPPTWAFILFSSGIYVLCLRVWQSLALKIRLNTSESYIVSCNTHTHTYIYTHIINKQISCSACVSRYPEAIAKTQNVTQIVKYIPTKTFPNKRMDNITCNFNETFPPIQTFIRFYFHLPTIIIGIVMNVISVIIFSTQLMRRPPLNMYFLTGCLCDVLLLLSAFVVHVLPILVDDSRNVVIRSATAYFIRWTFPIATTTMTIHVYLTGTYSIN